MNKTVKQVVAVAAAGLTLGGCAGGTRTLLHGKKVDAPHALALQLLYPEMPTEDGKKPNSNASEGLKKVYVGFVEISQDSTAPHVVAIAKSPVTAANIEKMEVQPIQGPSQAEVVTGGIKDVLQGLGELGVGVGATAFGFNYEAARTNIKTEGGAGGAGGAGGNAKQTQGQGQGQTQGQVANAEGGKAISNATAESTSKAVAGANAISAPKVVSNQTYQDGPKRNDDTHGKPHGKPTPCNGPKGCN